MRWPIAWQLAGPDGPHPLFGGAARPASAPTALGRGPWFSWGPGIPLGPGRLTLAIRNRAGWCVAWAASLTVYGPAAPIGADGGLGPAPPQRAHH